MCNSVWDGQLAHKQHAACYYIAKLEVKSAMCIDGQDLSVVCVASELSVLTYIPLTHKCLVTA